MNGMQNWFFFRSFITKTKHSYFLAMMYKIPILSYNIKPTNYDDEMYKLIGGSFHANTVMN